MPSPPVWGDDFEHLLWTWEWASAHWANSVCSRSSCQDSAGSASSGHEARVCSNTGEIFLPALQAFRYCGSRCLEESLESSAETDLEFRSLRVWMGFGLEWEVPQDRPHGGFWAGPGWPDWPSLSIGPRDMWTISPLLSWTRTFDTSKANTIDKSNCRWWTVWNPFESRVCGPLSDTKWQIESWKAPPWSRAPQAQCIRILADQRFRSAPWTSTSQGVAWFQALWKLLCRDGPRDNEDEEPTPPSF